MQGVSSSRGATAVRLVASWAGSQADQEAQPEGGHAATPPSHHLQLPFLPHGLRRDDIPEEAKDLRLHLQPGLPGPGRDGRITSLCLVRHAS